MTHFITKCRLCSAVIAQCRCPSLHKPIRLETCEACTLRAAAPTDPVGVHVERLLKRLTSLEESQAKSMELLRALESECKSLRSLLLQQETVLTALRRKGAVFRA